jgi:phospholipase/carboxylesterase
MMDSPLKYIYKGEAPSESDKKGVIILLHGYGSNEMDLLSFGDELPSDYFVVSAQAPILLPWGGFAWFNLDFSGIEKIVDLEQAEQSRLQVIKFIEYIKSSYTIDAERIILLGFSQGAMLSQGVAMTRPDLLRGTIALSGFIMEDVLKENLAPEEEIKNLDFFIGHGSMDDVVPVEQDRKSKVLLENMGVNLEYHEYPVAHGILPEELTDIVGWVNSLS